MNTTQTESQEAVAGQVDRGVRPCAWITWGTMDGKTKLRIGEATTNPEYVAAHKAWCWQPLIQAPAGWRFERDHNNRIVVTMPDGGGCVVDNVANDARMVPEEVLFALCKALGA